MDKHYYLVSQLPYLFFDRTALIDSARFLAEAEKWRAPSELALLKKIDVSSTTVQKGDLPVVRAFKEFEGNLRRELGEWRKAQKAHQDYKLSLFPLSLIKDGNPLTAEKNLMLLQWQAIDEMEKDHHFDTQILVLFYLKLQLLERLAIFNKEQGLKKFKLYTEMEI